MSSNRDLLPDATVSRLDGLVAARTQCPQHLRSGNAEGLMRGFGHSSGQDGLKPRSIPARNMRVWSPVPLHAMSSNSMEVGVHRGLVGAGYSAVPPSTCPVMSPHNPRLQPKPCDC